MTKNEDLKACPWCNGKAYINNFKSQPCQMHGDRETMWRVQCKHKDAKWMDSSSLPECHVKPVVVASTREEAIERWNTRPTVTPADGGINDASFVKGYASCLANAVDLETYSPRDISGGMDIDYFEKMGVDEYDLKRLKEKWDV